MECVCLWVCLNFGVSACRLYNDTTTAAKLRSFIRGLTAVKLRGLFEGGAGQLVQNVLFLRRLLRQLRVQLPDHHATHTVTGRQQSRSANTNTHKHTHLENMPRRQTLHDIVISLSLSDLTAIFYVDLEQSAAATEVCFIDTAAVLQPTQDCTVLS